MSFFPYVPPAVSPSDRVKHPNDAAAAEGLVFKDQLRPDPPTPARPEPTVLPFANATPVTNTSFSNADNVALQLELEQQQTDLSRQPTREHGLVLSKTQVTGVVALLLALAMVTGFCISGACKVSLPSPTSSASIVGSQVPTSSLAPTGGPDSRLDPTSSSRPQPEFFTVVPTTLPVDGSTETPTTKLAEPTLDKVSNRPTPMSPVVSSKVPSPPDPQQPTATISIPPKTTLSPVLRPTLQPFRPPTSQPVPQGPTLRPQPAPMATPPSSSSARATTILSFINSITRSGRTLRYPNTDSAEERAVQWLIENDVNTASSDRNGLRQRYALATLWFQNDFASSDSNLFATWAIPSINECAWQDVACDSVGRVTRLDLGNGTIGGRIPNDLALLTTLIHLSLYNHSSLTGTIPSSLGELSALTYLYLWRNRLTGTIPSSLGELVSLNGLWLHTNLLTGTIPSSIGALTALTVMDLYNNQLTGAIPSSLGALTVLTDLWLSNNQLRGTIPTSLGALTALTGLNLFHNQLAGTIPSSLRTLTTLRRLFLYNNQLTGTIPSSLATLTALTRLYLYNNQLTGTMPLCNSDQRFDQLVTDCNEVSCFCCTHCCPAGGWGGIQDFGECDTP